MKSLKPKISIIGAGNVGASYAFALMMKGIAREIVIVDLNRKKADGECMDLNHGLSFARPARILSTDYDGCAESDIVVITAGAKQKEGESRIDLVKTNANIFKKIIPSIMKYAKDVVIVVVTNPVDILTYVSLKISGLPENRVIGSGTVLDTSRFRYLISDHCGIDPRNVHAYIIGEHGDTEVPVWSGATIGGMRINEYCPACAKFSSCEREKELSKIFDEVKNAAYRIIETKGATYYAIALALVRITEAIIRDESSVLPVSTMINDYYGVEDVCLGIPSMINKKGIERFLKIPLSPDEQKKFKQSAGAMKAILKDIKL